MERHQQTLAPRRAWVGRWAWAAVVIACAGCSGPGPYMRRQTTLGALKSSVARLENEKDGLTRELAEQKAEARRLQDEVLAVEDKNNELATRLDDARAVISRGMLDEGRSSSASRSSEEDLPPPRRSTPARSQPRKGKTPFAQIPSPRRSLDEPTGDDGEEELERPSTRSRDDIGPQGRLDDRSPWMPVARGVGSPTASRR